MTSTPTPTPELAFENIFGGLLLNTAGFAYGFFSGGLTGYFGNWLWHRFGSFRKKPHFTIESTGDSVSFSGFVDYRNVKQATKALQYSVSQTTPPEKSVKEADSTSPSKYTGEDIY